MRPIIFALILIHWTLIGLAFSQTEKSPITLGHGVNLGNFLEAPREGEWNGNRLLKEADFSTIRQAGFAVVRIPISWAAHVGPQPDYGIDPTFLQRVDTVLGWAEMNDLHVILDDHNDDHLMRDPEANGDRFVAIWKQLAEHYQSAPSNVAFELLNEPNGHLDASHWNALLARTLKVIRITNPDRPVVIGPTGWNDASQLPNLFLPEGDRNLIVTFHFYSPLSFTHQGASWMDGSSAWLGNKWLGTSAEKEAITQIFDKAADWGRTHHRPIFLGEFGAYEKGEMESRSRWTAFVARTAESHDFAWTYWEYCAGFGAFDPQAEHWRRPLLDALLPKPLPENF